MPIPITQREYSLLRLERNRTIYRETIPFRLPAESDAFLSNIYSMLQDEPEMNLYTGASDEMEIAYGPHPSHLFSSGDWNPTTAIVNDYWNHYYNTIRKCNIFLANADKVPTGSDEINNWKGEVYFLRAFNYFLLVRLYGTVIRIMPN